MDELATQLIQLKTGDTSGTNLPSAIFGTAGQLSRYIDQRERVRIGLWPIVSEAEPEVAMGMAVILAFLLDRWTDIRVYQLLVSVEDEPEDDYIWDITQSQFGIDDWQLDPLDENVAIWGSLQRDDAKYTLEIDVENDLLDDREEKNFTIEALDLAGIIHLLPKLSVDIADYLGSTGAVSDTFDESSSSDTALSELLTALFTLQRRLFLFLWGIEYTVQELETDLNMLIAKSRELPADLCAWIVSNAVAHAMHPGYEELSDFSATTASYVVESFPQVEFPFTYLAMALYRQGKVVEAIEMLKAGVSQHPQYANGWRIYAELYRLSGRFRDAVDIYQQAIENDVEDVTLFRRYGSTLEAMDMEALPLDDFILIDPDEYDRELVLHEAVAAYGEALQREPEHVGTLRQQVLLLVDLEELDQLWPAFQRLVALDEDGGSIREVVDAMYNLEDLQPALDALTSRFEQLPDRIDLLISQAVAYLNLEDSDRAYTLLERASDLAEDADIQSDIQRLMLAANDPEFETRLGEIKNLVEAGQSLENDDMDFIEDAIEDAPLLSELYVVHARANMNWEENDLAMNTLLDGIKENPNDPGIVELLAQLLWDSGEHDLAFDYLNKAVEEHPHHVPLLALTGQYLAENDQRDAARTYLLRAEAISPTHPALRRVRQNIAQMHLD